MVSSFFDYIDIAKTFTKKSWSLNVIFFCDDCSHYWADGCLPLSDYWYSLDQCWKHYSWLHCVIILSSMSLHDLKDIILSPDCERSIRDLNSWLMSLCWKVSRATNFSIPNGLQAVSFCDIVDREKRFLIPWLYWHLPLSEYSQNLQKDWFSSLWNW
jgi:hypothetical protein